MTINIFVLKGDLNGKIVMVRFFFCRVYIHTVLKYSILAFSPYATKDGMKKSEVSGSTLVIKPAFSFAILNVLKGNISSLS